MVNTIKRKTIVKCSNINLKGTKTGDNHIFYIS